jgi:hypothetical protein
MTTQTETTETETPTVEVQQQPLAPEERLSKGQQLAALKQVFEFLSNYDRVPGNLTSTWSQVLDALALVHNSLVSELSETVDLSTTKETEE